MRSLRIRSAVDLRKAGRRESRQAKRHDDPVNTNPLKLIVTETGDAAAKAVGTLSLAVHPRAWCSAHSLR